MQGESSMASNRQVDDYSWLWNYTRPPKPVIHMSQLSGILVPRCSPAYVHLPPLNIMCPIDESFEVVDWAGFETGFQAWWESHCTDPVNVKDLLKFKEELLDMSSNLTAAVLETAADAFMAEEEECAQCLAGQPELSIMAKDVSFNGASLRHQLIGVTANGDRSLYPFARLWAYMFFNNVSYGLVAFDDERLALCMRHSTQQQLLRAHIALRQDATTLFKLGYLMNLARNGDSFNNNNGTVEAQALTLWKPVCSGVSRLNVLRHRLMDLAKEMRVAKLKDMATKVEFVDVSSLQGMVRLHSARESCVIRAAWKGKQVVLKMRDLTASDGWEEELKKTIKEVDMYMRLHKLQGRCIPMLYSLGFLHGGMFSFLMMSDARVGDVEQVPCRCPPEVAVAAIQGSREAVRSMHNRGILHGDIEFSNVAVSRRPSGNYVGMLLGFSQARLVHPEKQRHLLAKELLGLERMFKETGLLRRGKGLLQQGGDEEECEEEVEEMDEEEVMIP